MGKTTKKLVLCYLATAVLGVLLHFLFTWFPNPVLALICPVRESIWEHVKLIYFPLLAASLYMGRGGNGLGRAPWLLSLIVACVVTLCLGYVYHIIFQGEAVLADVILYLFTLALGFRLPKTLWPVCGQPGVEKAAWAMTVLLGALIVWFTFFPPNTALFADMRDSVRTFLTIPV